LETRTRDEGELSMTTYLGYRQLAVALVVIAALAVAALTAVQAGATVPPKNCGNITVKSRAYQIKADQVRCATAKRYAKRYLSVHDAPSGWRCRDFSSSRMKFRCTRGVRVVFAIKR
jgi:hypothetical protein